MAHGLPIVATPFHHALEALHANRGFIVPYDDDGTLLARALNTLLADNNMRRHMASHAPDDTLKSAVCELWTVKYEPA